MKVLLVSPYVHPQTITTVGAQLLEPLALEYIGAGIREHHEVQLLDLNVEKGSVLKDTLEAFQPDIIACCAYTVQVNPAKEIFALAKKSLPGILKVIGGHHATLVPNDFFVEDIDVVVSGEGVYPFKKICDSHQKKRSFADIENIYYRKDGKMVFTRKQEHPPLDSLPFPDRSLIARFKHAYRLNELNGISSIRSSTGCFNHCKFCSVSPLLNYKVYFRSIDKVLEELSSVDSRILYWVDDELFLNPKRTLQLAKEIEKAGIKKHHFFEARADSISNNPECIEAWATIGVKSIFIGCESHRDEEIKEMRKGTSLALNEEAVRICHANHIKVRGNFIINPNYGKKDFRSLTTYVRKVGVDYPCFSVLTPFPGSQLYEEWKDKLISHNLSIYDGIHPLIPGKLPLKQFFKEFIRLLKKRIPLRVKLRLFRKIGPTTRKNVISHRKTVFERIKRAHLDYD